MKDKQVFIASDGTEYDDYHQALAHETTLANTEIARLKDRTLQEFYQALNTEEQLKFRRLVNEVLDRKRMEQV